MRRTGVIPLSRFLRSLGRQLEKVNIRLLVLRNYSTLPTSISSTDIDLLILPKNIKLWEESLYAVCKDLKLECLKGPSSYIMCGKRIRGISGSQVVLHIDVFKRLNWYGVNYSDPREVIIRSRRFSRYICIPESADEIIITLCKSILHGHDVKGRTITDLSKRIHKCRSRVSGRLADIFGKTKADSIINAIIVRDLCFFDNICKWGAGIIRLQALARAFSRRPIATTGEAILSAIMRIRLLQFRLLSKYCRENR